MKKLAGQLSYFFKGNPPAVLGTIIIGAFIFFSVFAPVFAPYGPTERDPLKFKFTAQTLEELKEKRTPDAVLQQLAALEGQEFTDDDAFEAAVEQQIGAKDAKKHGRRIQRAARWDAGHLPPGPGIFSARPARVTMCSANFCTAAEFRWSWPSARD